MLNSASVLRAHGFAFGDLDEAGACPTWVGDFCARLSSYGLLSLRLFSRAFGVEQQVVSALWASGHISGLPDTSATSCQSDRLELCLHVVK